VWGADVDAEAVAWCSEHLAGVKAITCAGLPPLDAPAGHFDLVVANSVFTHLDESFQDAWLDELLRVTRPGATLVLSVHGEYALRQLEEPHRAAGTPGVERWRRELDTRGIFFWHDDGLDPSVFPEYYHTTFHAVWYLYAHWGARFEIVAHVPRGLLDHQDYMVLRHPTAERPAMPVPAPHAAPADELERLLEGPDATAAAGPLRQAYRRAVLRAVRHPLVHQQLVNRALGGVAREALRTSARAESLAREALREAHRARGSADGG
jgi:SAM-dependent methyltransferase